VSKALSRLLKRGLIDAYQAHLCWRGKGYGYALNLATLSATTTAIAA